MTHSLYESKSRWKKASAESKSVSSLHRRINNLKKCLDEVYTSNKLKKMQLTNFSNLIDYLMERDKINKEEIKKFLTTKKEAIEELKEKKMKEDLKIHMNAAAKRQIIARTKWEGRKELLEKIDTFIKERTSIKNSNQIYPEGTKVSLVKFMPFEWEDFKEELKCR